MISRWISRNPRNCSVPRSSQMPIDRLGLSCGQGFHIFPTPELKTWLAAFGVRNFITQEPSDLEYDPQLRVVAEWRDLETLKKGPSR